MSIDRSLLETLTSDQVTRASAYLEKIYSQNKTNISLEPSDFVLFSTLIQASLLPEMKQKLFFSLSVASQTECFTTLIYSDQCMLLIGIKNTELLKSLFLTLEPSLQHDFLTMAFKSHPKVYNQLKQANKPSSTLNHGNIIEKTNTSSQQLKSFQTTLFTYIQDPSFSPSDVLTYVESIIKTLDSNALDTFVESTFTTFLKLKIPLTSKENFASYLKFFNVSVTFVVIHPQHGSILDSIIDTFLMLMEAITDDKWVIKILDQIPVFILKKCCLSLSLYEKIKNNRKRNLFLKFYKLLSNHSKAVSEGNIVIAMNQI